MSISKMKLINISGPMSKFDVTASEILRQECFQPENVRNVLSGFRKLASFQDENPYKEVLKKILDFARCAGVKPEFISAKFDEPLEVMSEKIDVLYSQLQQYDTKILELNKTIEDDNLILHQMDFLAGLNVDIRDLFALKFIKFRFGKIRKSIYQRMGYLNLKPFQKEENPYTKTFKQIKNITGKYKIDIKPADSGTDKGPEIISKKISEIDNCIQEHNSIITDAEKRIKSYKSIVELLDVISENKENNPSLREMLRNEFVSFRVGHLSKEAYKQVCERDASNYIFIKSCEESDNIHGIYFVPRRLVVDVDSMFESLGFEYILISRKAKGKLGEFRKEVEELIREENHSLGYAEKARNDYISELTVYVNSVITGIDVLRNEAEEKILSDSLVDIGMSGWISEDMNPFVFIETGNEEDSVFGAYFAPAMNIECVDTLFASLQFERIHINERALGTPDEVKKNTDMEYKKLNEKLEEILKEKKSYIENIIKYINAVYSDVMVLNKASELKKTSGHSENNFYMSGWVDEDDFFRFVNAIESIGDIRYIVENPSFIKTTVPTKLKNFWLFKPFELFTRMYGIPGYSEIDPTPLVAISYLLFFGIMFGDLGQGAIILIIGVLLWKLKKMLFGKILMSCGVSSMIFGTIYDSIFGYEGTINRRIFGNEEIEIGYSPAHNMMQTLLITVSIGVGFILIAMLFNIINGLRQKDFEKAFMSQNGVAGLVFYTATIYIVVDLLLLDGGPVSKAYIICLIALPLFFIFFRKPITRLFIDKKNRPHESIGEFLIENVFELFEDMLSFVTNTVSFVRIGAFALSHAGMMFVVFLLANTTATASIGSGNPIVVIFGNIIIMGLEGLVVGIQGLRLEFYEIFSRFYIGDGIDFLPAKIENSKPN